MKNPIRFSSKNKINYEVVLIASLPAYLGAKQHSGLGNVVWGLAKELKKNGVNFAILARGKYYKKYTRINDIEIYGIGFSLIVFIKLFYYVFKGYRFFICQDTLSNKIRLLYALYFLIYFKNRVNYNLIHLHHVTNQFPTAVRILNLRIPILAHIHSYSNLINESSEERRKQILDNINRQLNFSDFIIHVSNSVKEQGKKYGIKWNVDDKVIYNGISHDFSTIENLTKEKAEGVICFAGAFLKIKGVEIFLDSLSEIKNEVKKIIWIGEGPLKSKIINRCESLNIVYELKGLIPNEELLSIISSCNLLVVPSKSESFGQVYLESILMGTPVIGYRPILREFKQRLLCNSISSRLFIEFDSSNNSELELIEMIRTELESPAITDYELNDIRNKILSKIQWDKLIVKYLNIYDKLLRKGER